jgi:hypothetical protein
VIPPEHLGEQFDRQRQLMGVGSILTEKQPASETLLIRMHPVAESDLRDLKPQEKLTARAPVKSFFPDCHAGDTVTGVTLAGGIVRSSASARSV